VVFLGCALSLRIQPKRFELPTPFRWSIAQPFDVDASRQAALHGRADQLGSKKGERDSQVDMTDAALLAQRNLLSISDGACDNFVQPTCPYRKSNPLAVDRESGDAAARCLICAN
jgi:hypothetical protein